MRSMGHVRETVRGRCERWRRADVRDEEKERRKRAGKGVVGETLSADERRGKKVSVTRKAIWAEPSRWDVPTD